MIIWPLKVAVISSRSFRFAVNMAVAPFMVIGSVRYACHSLLTVIVALKQLNDSRKA
jgi:hypothetical protein